MDTTKKISRVSRFNADMSSNNPKALDVLKEIQADLLDMTDNDPVVYSVTRVMISQFRVKTRKPMKVDSNKPPQIGQRFDYNGVPCWVIDVANDGAWFGVVEGISRIDRNKGAFRRYDSPDYPKEVPTTDSLTED